MSEETKEEYVARHRRELGIAEPQLVEVEIKRPTWKERLRTILFLVCLFLFVWVILAIFGMMNGN